MNGSALIRTSRQYLLFGFSTWLLVGPLALLQMGAWAWMLVNYSQESSIQIAVSETFSGERPCRLCNFIADVDTKQSKLPIQPGASALKDIKLMLGLSRPIQLPSPIKNHLGVPVDQYFIKEPVLEKRDPPPRVFV